MYGKRHRRDGFAALFAIFTLVILGALVTAMAFSADEDTRASGAALRSARTLSSAESSAWQIIASNDWRAAMSLRPGQIARMDFQGFAGPTTVSVARLDTTCFLIQSTASSGTTGSQRATSQRRIGITIEVGADSAGGWTAFRLPLRAWMELF